MSERKRTAVTMWEFSWLVRRQGPEAEYADWDRVLDELGERGYDCIRIDAFPHLIARGADGKLVERFTMLPQRRRFMWGCHSRVDVEPRAGLVDFVQRAAGRGMRVGLSTWFNDDTLHRRAEVRTAADYSRIWIETLELLDGEGLLANVEWVDPCNEFPLAAWAHGAFPRLFRTPRWNLAAVARRWKPEVRTAVQRHIDESISAIRARFPHLLYGYSFQVIGSRDTRELDLSGLDMIEPHIWFSDLPAFTAGSGQALALLEVPGGVRLHAKIAPTALALRRKAWLRGLSRRMDTWKRVADRYSLPLYTSEAWGPTNYGDVTTDGDAGEWGWVKDVCAEGVRMAVDKGWTGICTSNFCQPHFPGMWDDIDYHRRLTGLIRGREPGPL